MILDTMEHAALYESAGELVQKVLEAEKKCAEAPYETGRLDVDGDKAFLLRNAYETHDVQGALMEAHKKYIDVMYMVEGEETIYVKPTDRLSDITQEYDPAGDALLASLDEDVTAVRLCAGQFIILFPQDAHCPACHAGKAANVKKIIGKVQIG